MKIDYHTVMDMYIHIHAHISVQVLPQVQINVYMYKCPSIMIGHLCSHVTDTRCYNILFISVQTWFKCPHQTYAEISLCTSLDA